MAHFSMDCPHCSRQNTGFISKDEVAHPELEGAYQVFCMCFACKKTAIVLFAKKSYGSITLSPHTYNNNPEDLGYDILLAWPKSKDVTCPNFTPDKIKTFYIEASECLSRGSYNAAAPLFRKVLEITVKRMDPTAPSGSNLKNRIDRLPAETGVTPSMKEWAHEIRLIGNEAVHEDDPIEEKDAKDIQAFTELFLTYAFTLPGMLEERRKAWEGERA